MFLIRYFRHPNLDVLSFCTHDAAVEAGAPEHGELLRADNVLLQRLFRLSTNPKIIQGHSDGTISGGKAMMQSIEAVMSNTPVLDCAREKKELSAAIEK